MKRRTLPLSVEEETELHAMIDNGELDSIRELHRCTYREAYFIRKGMIMPAYAVDDLELSRWF